MWKDWTWTCRCLWRPFFLNRRRDLTGYARKTSAFLLENRATRRGLSIRIFRKIHKMVCTAGQTEKRRGKHSCKPNLLICFPSICNPLLSHRLCSCKDCALLSLPCQGRSTWLTLVSVQAGSPRRGFNLSMRVSPWLNRGLSVTRDKAKEFCVQLNVGWSIGIGRCDDKLCSCSASAVNAAWRPANWKCL